MWQSFDQYIRPLKAGGGLLHFLRNARLPVYSGNKQLDLMDILPMAKQGLVATNIITPLLMTYVDLHGLYVDGQIKFDALMNEAFAGNIPVLFHMVDDYQRINLEIAIKEGLINPPYNTIESIRSRFNGILPDVYRMILHFYLAGPNTEGLMVNSTIKHDSQQAQLLRQLPDEFYVIRTIGQALMKAKVSQSVPSNRPAYVMTWGKINLYSLIGLINRRVSKEDGDFTIKMICERLPGIDLLTASVAFDKLDYVKSYLQTFDPRNNNYEAYRQALLTKNQQIIDLIRDNILQTEFYEKEVFKTGIERQLNQSTNLPDTIYNTFRS